MRRAYRFLLLLLHIGAGWGVAAFLLLRRKLLGRPPGGHPTVRWWMGRLCRLLRVRVRSAGAVPVEPVFLSANHISWLDIPVIGGLAGLAFVSKAEIRDWPVFGWMAAQGGTLFIPRGAGQAGAISQAITSHIGHGSSVLVFPEGTTTDGSRLRPFYPRLFAGAVAAGAVIQPVAIRYLHPEGPHPTAPFIDDETFPAHLWRVLGEREMEAEVHFLERFPADEADRRSLAGRSRRVIAEDLGLADATETLGLANVTE